MKSVPFCSAHRLHSVVQEEYQQVLPFLKVKVNLLLMLFHCNKEKIMWFKRKDIISCQK